ncbi:hypothetical protein RE2895_24380 [Rhodococcus erythropolis]|nr:hypothetical protein RE2895_24380 [Rhodococcus erythropolis]
MKERLDKCPLDGDLPDGTCKYVGRAYREGYGVLCKQHDYRYRVYGNPYAKPLSSRAKEPTYAESAVERAAGNYSRNIPS